MIKKILVISYTFPPTPGIGGRRWAKFTKYLTASNCDFHVIHSSRTVVEGDFWKKDIVDNPKIKRYPVDFKFNRILANSNPSFFQKVLYKLIMPLVSRSKYNPFDNSAFSEKKMVRLATKLIKKEKIDTLVVTGAPFSLLYFGAKIKEKTGVKLILDYRDMWNGHPTFSVHQNLSQKQIDYGLFQEKIALKNADVVLAVNEGLKNVLINLNDDNDPDKFHVVNNGYDQDDFFLDVPKLKNQHIRLVFAGSIDINLSEITLDFLNVFKSLKTEHPDLYQRFKMIFHVKTNDPELYEFMHDNEDENFQIYDDFLPKNDYYASLRNAECGMFFLSKVYSDAFITKFSDFMVNENFMIQVGYEGQCSSYLANHKIGMTYKIGDGASFFEKLSKVNFESAYSDFQNDEFNIEKLALRIKKLMA